MDKLVTSIKVKLPFQVTWTDYPDDESCAIAVYCVGCDFSCHNCHNPELQDKNYKDEHTHIFYMEEFIGELRIVLKKNNTNKVVLLGGDFCSKGNIKFTKEFCNIMGEELDICIYTGHSFYYIMAHDIIGWTFLKTERYNNTKKQLSGKNDSCFILGSTNQKLYKKYTLISEEGIYNYSKGDK